MSPLKIFLLGKFEVLQNDLEMSHKLWQSRQLRGILKILVAARGRPVSSSQIIEILWPDEDPKSAQQHLYVRISQLRKLLQTEQNDELLQKVEGGYLFGNHKYPKPSNNNNRYWVDVDQFELLADQGSSFLEEKQFRSAI